MGALPWGAEEEMEMILKSFRAPFRKWVRSSGGPPLGGAAEKEMEMILKSFRIPFGDHLETISM